MLNKKKVRQGKAEIRAQLGYMQQTALLAGRPDSAPLLPNQPTLALLHAQWGTRTWWQSSRSSCLLPPTAPLATCTGGYPPRQSSSLLVSTETSRSRAGTPCACSSGAVGNSSSSLPDLPACCC